MGGSQEKTGSGCESSTNGEAKPRRSGSRAEQGSRGKGRDQDKSQDQLTVTPKSGSLVSKTRPSGFYSLRTEEDFKDYCARDGSRISLVSSKSHA
jgi:hypothetical protein